MFAGAELDDDLADALFAVLSNIHLDPRPLFDTAGLLDVVEVRALSFELGIRKLDPEIFFRHTLKELGTPPDQGASSTMSIRPQVCSTTRWSAHPSVPESAR